MAIPTVSKGNASYVEKEEIYGPTPDEGTMAHIADRLRNTKVKADEDHTNKINTAHKRGWMQGYNWAVGDASYYDLKKTVEEVVHAGNYEREGYVAACKYIFRRVDI